MEKLLLFSGFQLLSYCRQRSIESTPAKLIQEVVVENGKIPPDLGIGEFRGVIIPNGKRLFQNPESLNLRYSIEIELHYIFGHYALAYIYMTSDYKFKLYVPNIASGLGQIGQLMQPDRQVCYDNFVHAMLNKPGFIEYDESFICYERKYKNL